MTTNHQSKSAARRHTCCRAALIAAFGIFLSLAAVPVCYSNRIVREIAFAWELSQSSGKLIGRKPLRWLRSGVTIDLIIRPGDKDQRREFLRCRTPGHRFLVTSLDQLNGAVQLLTADDVLGFVRLRTEPEYTDCWPGSIVWEVKRTDEVLGDVQYPFPRNGSGSDGVLSPSAYRLGKFFPPKVVSVVDGFIVTRWIWVCDSSNASRVELWREHVTMDGHYRLDVLSSSLSPSLPDTYWGVMWPA